MADESEKNDEETGEADDANEAQTAEGDNITAPSIGPNTVIHHEPPEERLDHDKISDTDALGLDKRRQVTGKRYAASPAKQALLYGIFVVVMIGVVIGGKALADKLDQPPTNVKDQAPWTGNSVQVRPLDFPQYGQPGS